MARPADWQPLADSDPVPGDPVGIAQEASHLASVADQIASQVAVLRKIAASQGDEAGQHAGKLQSSASDTADQLDKVSGRYRQTAAALNAWVPELEYAQSQSIKALAAAQDAHARQSASQAAIGPAGGHPTPAEQQAEHARKQRNQQATADLSAAHGMLNDAVNHRDQKASETAGKIQSAISAEADSWWDSFSGWVSDHADIIKKIADIAGIVATVCGLLSLVVGWIPIVGQILAAVLDTIATLATAVALICHLLLWVTGNGSWVDCVVDVIALLTLGMGRVFAKTGEEGFTAARAATRGPVARMISKQAEGGLARSAITAKAEEATGFTAKAAKGVVQDAKAGLKLPSWHGAALGGLKTHLPQELAKGLGDSFKSAGHWSGSGFKVGDAAMHGAGQQFGKLAGSYRIAHLPSVSRWTEIAGAARTRYYISTGAGVGVDLFDKAASYVPQLPGHPQAPVLSQWSHFKESSVGMAPYSPHEG